MPRRTIAEGECLNSIAALYRFSDYQLSYGDGANAALRAQRPHPNVLLPGDVVVVPERIPPEYTCPTDARHRFILKRATVRLRMVPKGRTGPMAQRRVQRGSTAKGEFLTCALGIGALDREDVVSGVQSRRDNRRFFCGRVDVATSAKLLGLHDAA